MSADIETVVVGAGVIGLAIAAELARHGQSVLVLERNTKPGTETSSRNSGVIHAGLYYKPGSLRAKLCISGQSTLIKFCKQNGVPFATPGKLIVATQDDDLDKLNAIGSNAKACGVNSLTLLDQIQVKHREPQLQCKAALYSPSTSIVDTHALMTALEGHIHSCNAQIILNTTIVALERNTDQTFRIQTRDSNNDSPATAENPTTLTAKNLVIAAGLSATDLADTLFSQPTIDTQHTYTPPRTHFAKGHYYALGKPAPFESLIYPIPSNSGLGIHLTIGIDGSSRFGPDVTWTDTIDYQFEDDSGERARKFESSIRRYWPDLPSGALQPDSTGIRPRTYSKGEPVTDFAIHGPNQHGFKNLVALFGIDSPGLTSALAIAPLVANLLGART